eukprot:COSAG01_NODE_1630_length_9676_cov_5.955101_1_plen_274_part_00
MAGGPPRPRGTGCLLATLPRPERQKKHSHMVQRDILLLLAAAAVLELAVPLKIDIDDGERERDQRGAPPPPPRFPPPRWVPTWNLTQSTMIQPSSAGYFTPAHTWGLVSLDWTVARSVWLSHGRNRQDCEAVSTEGCRRLKASGLAHRCFVYHNMELALEWLESQRVAMRSPSKSGFFLQCAPRPPRHWLRCLSMVLVCDGSDRCVVRCMSDQPPSRYTDGFGHKNGTVYDELGRFGGRVMGDQYFCEGARARCFGFARLLHRPTAAALLRDR